MSVKTVAAIIVASLVAGVVLGSFGIAGAGTGSVSATGACPPGMSSGDCATAEDCSDCGVEAQAAPKPQACPPGMDCPPGMECGSAATTAAAQGACTDCP